LQQQTGDHLKSDLTRDPSTIVDENMHLC